jgi:TolA-binding protein
VTLRGALVSAICIAAAAAGGCATTPPDQDPVQIKLNDLDTRLTRIERVFANQSLLDLANQLEALRADVRGMHNDVDTINHNLESMRKQQRDLYADLDQRMKALEARGGAGNSASAGAAAAGAGTGVGASMSGGTAGGPSGPGAAGVGASAGSGSVAGGRDLSRRSRHGWR